MAANHWPRFQHYFKMTSPRASALQAQTSVRTRVDGRRARLLLHSRVPTETNTAFAAGCGGYPAPGMTAVCAARQACAAIAAMFPAAAPDAPSAAASSWACSSPLSSASEEEESRAASSRERLCALGLPVGARTARAASTEAA
eukprot:6206432-Pleurochrysis_carterae.AAC.3